MASECAITKLCSLKYLLRLLLDSVDRDSRKTQGVQFFPECLEDPCQHPRLHVRNLFKGVLLQQDN